MIVDTFSSTFLLSLFLDSQVMLEVFCEGSLNTNHVVLNDARVHNSTSYPKLLKLEQIMYQEEHQGKKGYKFLPKPPPQSLPLNALVFQPHPIPPQTCNPVKYCSRIMRKVNKVSLRSNDLRGGTREKQSSFGMVCPGLTMFTTGPSAAASTSDALTEISNVGNFSMGDSRVLSTTSNVSSLVVDRKRLHQDLTPSPKEGKQRSWNPNSTKY